MNYHYEYDATLVKVVDGDTVDMNVDLGFDIKISTRFRLYGINTPEMNTPEGKLAKIYLESLLSNMAILSPSFLVSTIKDRREKYGRYLLVIHYNETITINQMMIDNGHAVEYMV